MTGALPRIAEVEAIPLRAPRADPTDLDASTETVLVRIVDEDGVIGIGEADAPAGVVRELVLMDDLFAWSRGLRKGHEKGSGLAFTHVHEKGSGLAFTQVWQRKT